MHKLILPLIITFGAIYFGVRTYLSSAQPSSINLITPPSPSPYVALTFEPYFEVKNANTTTRWGITVSLSEEFTAKTARLDIAYSPNCLTPTITAGTDFPRLVGPVGMGNGTIKATFSAGSTPVTQYGIIAYLTTGPKASGDCQLSFNPSTKILGTGNQNILTSTTPGFIKLKTTDPILPTFKQPTYHPDSLSR